MRSPWYRRRVALTFAALALATATGTARVPFAGAPAPAVGAPAVIAADERAPTRPGGSLPAARAAPAAVTSEGVEAHNAASWHLLGYTGDEVAVGIIDRFAGYSALVGHELPPPTAMRCYGDDGSPVTRLAACERGSDHGTGMGEAIIDVAPGAHLFLANPVTNDELLDAVKWMTANGVRVVVYAGARAWDGPGDGTSPSATSPLAAVDTAVAGGATWIAAAGNGALSTWHGSYADEDGDGWLSFGTCGETDRVFLDWGDVLTLQLRWDDSWTAAGSDLDLLVFRAADRIPIAAGYELQDGQEGQTPHELVRFEPVPGGWFEVRVRHVSGPAPEWVELQAFEGQVLDCWVPGHSIANPAESANPGLLAVGAARGPVAEDLEAFSSRGPTRDGRTKPDLVALDGADSTGGPWLGTSQAAAHVAGLAAILVQAYPDDGAVEIAARLRAWARPVGDPVPNNAWGYGYAWLPSLPDDLGVDDWPDTYRPGSSWAAVARSTPWQLPEAEPGLALVEADVPHARALDRVSRWYPEPNKKRASVGRPFLAS